MKPPTRRILRSNINALPAAPKSGIDTFLTRASSTAQIAAVLLAGFGYFYTVIPVFQNQKLQEDNAQLQMNNAKLQADTKREEEKLEKLTKDYEIQSQILQASLLQEKNNLKETTIKLEAAVNSEKQARTAVSRVNEKLKTELASLDQARWKIVMNDFIQFTYFATLPEFEKLSEAIYEKDSNGAEFILKAEAAWPDLLEPLTFGIDTASNGSNEIPTGYYDKIKKYIKSHSNELSCPKLNFKALGDEYLKELESIAPAAKKSALAEIEKQRKAAELKGSKLLVRDGDIKDLTQNYELTKTLTLQAKYREIILTKNKACTDLLPAFFDTLRKDLNIPSKESKSN